MNGLIIVGIILAGIVIAVAVADIAGWVRSGSRHRASKLTSRPRS